MINFFEEAFYVTKPMLRFIRGILLLFSLTQLSIVNADDEKKQTPPKLTAQNYAAPQLDEPTGELALPQALALALLKTLNLPPTRMKSAHKRLRSCKPVYCLTPCLALMPVILQTA